jgi:hypothetical protein
MKNTSKPPLSVGRAAEALGVQPWQVRRVFDRGLLPTPARVGQYRVIPADSLPLVEAALRQAGYLRESEAAGA